MAVRILLRRRARLLCRFPGNKLTETLLLLLLGGSKVRAGPNFRRQLNNNDIHTHVFGWWVFRYDHGVVITLRIRRKFGVALRLRR